jgi:cell division protein FtsQ
MAFDKKIWINRIKLAGTILFWCVLTMTIISGWSFAAKEAEQITCNHVNVIISHQDEMQLINREQVLALFISNGNDSLLIGKPLQQIDISEIERQVKRHELIKHAQVFTDLNGELHIHIEQRRPILRVINAYNEHYFIDETGFKMPLSTVFTPHIPVATGYIIERYIGNDSIETFSFQSIFKIATYVDKHDFWKAQIEQIFVNEDNELILIHKLGNHTILFGTTENMESKFEKLLVFYLEGLNRTGWNKYSEIDVRFENQIVARKK